MKRPPLDDKCPMNVLEGMVKQYNTLKQKPDSLAMFTKDKSHDFYMGMMSACRVFSEMVKTAPIESVISAMSDVNVSAMLLAIEKKSPIIQMPGGNMVN